MSQAQRTVLRLGAVMLVLGGLIGFGFAIRFPGAGADPTPTQVPVGRAVTLPAPGLLGARPALYGVVAAGAEPPGNTALGCSVRASSGRAGSVFDLAWVGHDPQSVDGRTVTALLTFGPYTAGSTLTCTGPGAVSAAPLYLIRGGRNATLARVALTAFGVMALVIGTTGFLLLRPRDSGIA